MHFYSECIFPERIVLSGRVFFIFFTNVKEISDLRNILLIQNKMDQVK